jgi:CheY-like chemotaxis protein
MPDFAASSTVTTRPGCSPAVTSGSTHETILVVDDEPAIRKLATTILRAHGYKTLEAADGLEALTVFRNSAVLIDLVILDLTMPNLSGQETFRQLLKIDADAAVVFASGYTAESLGHQAELVLGFIKKPFRSDELLHTVRSALEKSPRRQRQSTGPATLAKATAGYETASLV